MAFRCARFSGEPEIVKAAADAPALRQGMSGDGVRALQLALIDLGYSMPISTHKGSTLPDGIFGSETARTVIQFQRANSLSADGVAGTHTLAKLDERIAVLSEAIARSAPLEGKKAKGLS